LRGSLPVLWAEAAICITVLVGCMPVLVVTWLPGLRAPAGTSRRREWCGLLRDLRRGLHGHGLRYAERVSRWCGPSCVWACHRRRGWPRDNQALGVRLLAGHVGLDILSGGEWGGLLDGGVRLMGDVACFSASVWSSTTSRCSGAAAAWWGQGPRPRCM
jgi:hypothetical protein